MKRLRGKTALITGAGQGIGRATAELFASHGADVIATDVDASKLTGLDGCRTHILDVLDEHSIRRALQDAGALDVLFNCAGYVAEGNVLDCSEADWDLSLRLNLTGMYRLCRGAIPSMIASGGGSIINMSSVASSVKGVPNRFAYSTSKAAVIGLTKSIAADFVTQAIRCNAICPGTVETPSLHQRLEATGDHDAAWEAFTARQPMGRVGRPEEIANLVLYFASDESSFTTGQCHIIDGGWAN